MLVAPRAAERNGILRPEEARSVLENVRANGTEADVSAAMEQERESVRTRIEQWKMSIREDKALLAQLPKVKVSPYPAMGERADADALEIYDQLTERKAEKEASTKKLSKADRHYLAKILTFRVEVAQQLERADRHSLDHLKRVQ
jgi:hypothetical protein